MALEYVLFNYMTGAFIRRNLPVNAGTDRAMVDLHSETIEVEVNFNALTDAEKNNWQGTFKRLARGIVVLDGDKVLAKGFIDKVKNPIGDGLIHIQCQPFNEYLAQTSINIWSEIVNEETYKEEKKTLSSDTWGNLQKLVVSKLFQPAPAGAPQPPSLIINDLTVPTTGPCSIDDDMEGDDYLTILENIRDKFSGSGVEWRFIPTLRDANTVGVVMVTGTDAVPHLNENVTLNIELSENSTEKISGFGATLDGRDMWNKVVLKHETVVDEESGETSETLIKAKWDNYDPEIPMFAKLVTTGTAMDDTFVDTLANAYLRDGKEGGVDVDFTIEEKWDRKEWIDHIGKKITFTGVPNTLSAGTTLTVRCVGVEFSKQKETVKVTFMPIQTRYPYMPKAKKQRRAFNPAEKIGKDSDAWIRYPKQNYAPPSGGGTTPTEPTPPPTMPEFGGTEGVFTPGDSFGDEGRNAWDTDINAKKLKNLGFRNYAETSKLLDGYPGKWPIHPWTMCKNGGNLIYGLDKAHQSFRTRYTSTGVEQRHFDGGIDPDTGLPFNGFQPFYIRKTYIVKGEVGPVVEAGIVTAEKIQSMLAPWVKNNGASYYKTKATYERGIGVSNWIAGGRFYFALGDMYRHKTDSWSTAWEANSYGPRDPQVVNSKISVISSSIDPQTNLLRNDWRDEKSDFPNYGFPMTPHISVYGNNVVFSSHMLVNRTLIINGMVDGKTFATWRSERVAATGYDPLGMMPIPFGVRANDTSGGFTANGYTRGGSTFLNAGNLSKNYADAQSPFHPYTGFNGTPNKYGGIGHYSFSSDGNLYGAAGVSGGVKVMRIRETPTGVAPDGIWVKGYHDADNKDPAVSYASNDTATPFGVKGFICFPLKAVTGGTYWRNGINFIKMDGFDIVETGYVGEAPYKDFGWYFRFNGSTNEPHALPDFQWPDNMNSEGGNLTTGGDNKNFVSRIFSYDGWVYQFYLDKDANGVRNTLKCKTMEAYDPTP